MPEEPQARKQHPVPQEVFGVQFKLIGDFTIRQFVFLAIAGVLAFAIFSSGLFLPIRLLLSIGALLIGVGLAFVPVQDQPLDQWLMSFLRAVYAPTRRVWVQSKEPPEFLTLEIPKIAAETAPGVSKEEAERRLQTYLEAVREKEGEISPLDLEEKQYLQSINVLARQITAPKAPPALPTPPPTPGAPPKEAVKPPEAPLLPEEKPAPPAPTLPELRFIEVQKIQKRPSLASPINWAAEKVYKVQRGEAASYFTTRKNVRVGRRLTPIAISGEAVYAPARERILEPELPGAPQLPPTPIQPVAQEPEPAPPAPEAPPAKPEPPPTPPPKEIPLPPPEEVTIKEEGKAPPPPPPQPKPEPAKEEKVEEPSAPPPPPPPSPLPTVKKVAPKVDKKPAPKTGEQANAIEGVVHDSGGGVLSQTLVVIKDAKGNVVRATRTNELGKFATASLPNGTYTLEIPKAPQPFDTIKLELTGEKVEELEIKPKG